MVHYRLGNSNDQHIDQYFVSTHSNTTRVELREYLTSIDRVSIRCRLKIDLGRRCPQYTWPFLAKPWQSIRRRLKIEIDLSDAVQLIRHTRRLNPWRSCFRSLPAQFLPFLSLPESHRRKLQVVLSSLVSQSAPSDEEKNTQGNKSTNKKIENCVLLQITSLGEATAEGEWMEGKIVERSVLKC